MDLIDYLTTTSAAKRVNLTPEYVGYLRSSAAAVRGLVGPPYVKIGSTAIYNIPELDIWNEERLAAKQSRR